MKIFLGWAYPLLTFIVFGLFITDWTYKTRNYDKRVKFLILHDTSTNDIERTIEAFNKSGTSAHYIIDKDAKIYRVVAEEKRAWHAGVSAWGERTNLNDTSIGIELVNSGEEEFSNEQIKAAAKLSKVILDKYRILPNNILAHADIAPGRKFDPSGYFNWQAFYKEVGLFPGLYISKLGQEEKQQVLQEGCPQEEYCTINCIEETEYREAIQELQQQLANFGYKISVSGYYNLETKLVMEAFNRHFCPEIFQKEKIVDHKVVQNPRNQRWYAISEERLAFLHTVCQSSSAK